MRDLEERLLSFLRERQGSSPREIADALGEPLQRVRAALQRLRDMGLVARGEEGRYYAVAPLVRRRPRAELRRGSPVELPGDLEALWARLAELEQELGELRRRLEELERRCRGGG